MIDNAAWQSILNEATDFSLIAEFYSPDAVPTSEGFDPMTAVLRMAAVDGITFMGASYQQLVRKFGRITRTMTEQTNTASVELSNLTRTVAQFEFHPDNGFEGMILVIRLISRARSTTLAKSQILFTGSGDRPLSGDKERINVIAKFILGSLNVVVPRRTYGPTDFKGRTIAHPEFEGFPNMPAYGTTQYNRIEHRGGFMRLWNNKEVRATLVWSNFSDYDASRNIAECFGVVQLEGVPFAAADVGPQVRMQFGFCEGPIQDFTNCRSIDPALPLNGTVMIPGGFGGNSYWETYGLIGAANDLDPTNFGWDTWPGQVGHLGYYSRLARIACQSDNSAMDVSDPAPRVVAVIEGKVITTPDAAGAWNTEAWTDNGAAVVRHFLTDPDYFNLDANWIDDEFFTETWNYNTEEIFNTSLSDFTFVEEG